MIPMSSLYTIPATHGVAITNNDTDNDKCRSIHVGLDGDYEFYFPTTKTWVLYNGCKAGADYPYMVTGARTAAGAAPGAGDITFNY